MDFISIILIAIALAMDAFSVSLTKGFTLKSINKTQILWFAIFFGGFQTLMPIIGWIGGVQLEFIVSTFAPWIAFILLLIIGINMIRESISSQKNEISNEDKFSFKDLFLLAIATSIDAFAVGVSYAVLKIDILIPVIIIGVVAFIFTIIGINLGKKIGNYFGDKFEILGGIILIFLGFKILLEGIGILIL